MNLWTCSLRSCHFFVLSTHHTTSTEFTRIKKVTLQSRNLPSNLYKSPCVLSCFFFLQNGEHTLICAYNSQIVAFNPSYSLSYPSLNFLDCRKKNLSHKTIKKKDAGCIQKRGDRREREPEDCYRLIHTDKLSSLLLLKKKKKNSIKNTMISRVRSTVSHTQT